MEHPKVAYYEDVKAIQQDRWNDVCGELGPVVADVFEYVKDDSNDHTPENLTVGAKAGLILRKVLDDREDLGDLEDKLEHLDEPKKRYRRCRKKRKRALVFLVIAFIGFGIVAVLLYAVTQTGIIALIETAIISISSTIFAAGFIMTKQSLDAREALDEMTEEKDFM